MSDNNSGVDGFDSSDIRLNYRQMVQPTSSVDGIDGAVAGTYVTKKTKELHGKEMKCVILSARKHRRLEADYKPGVRQRPVCWSHDMKLPAADVENPRSVSCDICEHNFKDIVISLVLLDVKATLEQGTPVVFRMDAKKKNTRSVGSFIGSVMGRKKHPRDYIVTFGTEKEQGKAFYFMVVAEDSMVTGDLKDDVDIAFDLFVKTGAVVEEEEEEDEPTTPIANSDIPFAWLAPIILPLLGVLA